MVLTRSKTSPKVSCIKSNAFRKVIGSSMDEFIDDENLMVLLGCNGNVGPS